MIDLHTHTSYSDGSFSVPELLEEAQKSGLSLLSITDHNSVKAYAELQDETLRNFFCGKIVPGIEITTTYKGEIIEILGYGIDIDKMNALLDLNVISFKEKSLREYELIKSKYKKIGVIFNENNIKFNAEKESCRVAVVNEIKKYPENNKFFLSEESITTASGFTRNEVYNPKSPLYIDQTSFYPSLEKVIEMVHQSGGLAFLAHTFAYSPNIASELQNIIDNYALDGLECFYTTFTREQSNYLVNLCKEQNLFMSGGSDFHGTRKVNHNLGVGRGNLNIDEKVVESWLRDYSSKLI